MPRMLVAVAVALLAAAPGAVSAAGSKRLLGYYASWTRTESPAYGAAQIPYRKLTHIAHAFLMLDSKADGSLSVPSGLVEPELITRAHKAGVKVLISIGGASDAQQRAFSAVARDAALRDAFVKNVHTFVDANGYDGVDVDWEVPNAPDDTTPCIELMRAFRSELPAPRYLLSMAIPSDPRGWGSGFDVGTLATSLDFVNMMTYDMHGPWTDHAGHHSPLSPSPDDPGHEGSIAESVDLFVNTYGVPPEKLNVGTGFYGYEFDGASKLWDSCACRSTTTTVNYGTAIKPKIDKLGWTAKVDKTSQAPYLVRSDGKGFITYDDAASTARKVDYALVKRRLGGVFMWDLSGDYDGRSQDLLKAMYRAVVRARQQ